MSSNNQEIHLLCPISGELMMDPVLCPDGISYSRQAIETWIEKNGTSPTSRLPLKIQDLRPNRALRNAIDAYLLNNKNPFSDLEESNFISNLCIDNIETPAPVNIIVKSNQLKDMTSDVTSIINISINTNDDMNRSGVDIVCVVDVSGSMGADVSIKDSVENTGLSILDIVRHALYTSIDCMSTQDRLAIVAFSDNAEIVFQLTSMNDSEKSVAKVACLGLQPTSSTNIWAGLVKGMEILQGRGTLESGRPGCIFLLTDGAPNINPPRGIIDTLKMYKDKHPIPDVINTFGFGYNLDSNLLDDISRIGRGSFSFIPDASFVGTVFVHAIANILSIYGTCASLDIECLNGAAIEEVVGVATTSVGEYFRIDIGNIFTGQPRNIILKMKGIQSADNLKLNLQYKFVGSGEKSTVSIESFVKYDHDIDSDTLFNYFRLLAYKTIRSNIKDIKEADVNDIMLQGTSEISSLLELIKKICDISNLMNEGITGIIKDLEGQVSESFSKPEWFMRWGRHYLFSLSQAYHQQLCNNFKDNAIQNFGGKLFHSLRDEADLIFCSLPAPKPSNANLNMNCRPSIVTSISMSAFHSRSNACFSGDSLIHMADGTITCVQEVKKGDLVSTDDGETATVQCIVKTLSQDSKITLVQLNTGLKIMPFHPIKINDEWIFPISVEKPKPMDCDAVYSFLLDRKGCSLVINSTVCAALGHGLTGSVIFHSYFGTEKVIADLKTMRGWDEGIIVLKSGCVIRDRETNLVIGLKQN